MDKILETRNSILEYSYHCNLDQLLQRTLDEVEALSNSNISFFHFVNEDQTTLSLQTWSTHTLQKMCTAEGKGHHYPIDQAGVWVDCVAARATVIHNDYPNLKHRKGLPDGHAPILRELVTPILRDDKIMAILGVGNKETDYDETDVLSISQIADMVWDIAERKQAAEEVRQMTETLTFLAKHSGPDTEQTFFPLLAQYLAKTLDANFICIDKLEGDGLNATTLSVWHDGEFEDNITYALKDTPCGEVVGKDVCCFPASVTKFFPRDSVLLELNAESYVGVTLWNHEGMPIGLIAVIRKTPLQYQHLAEELMKLVAVRASGELERIIVEDHRRQAEKELIKLKESLEQRVQERTQQLEVINKELQFHINEIEQFTYISSHDLQEPLRTLTNFTKLIQEEYGGKLNEEGNKYIEFISSSASRMRTLVSGLLDYSLLGKESILTTIDCNKTVDEVLSDLADSIEQTHATITVDPLPNIAGYSTEMRLLFQNLITNAIKFRNKEVTPVIRISAQKQDKAWVFSVADNGIGIKEQDKEKVFVIFKRMHNTREFPGTGIGLAHCKKIVELHQGKIWVDTGQKTGTAVKFTIPAA